MYIMEYNGVHYQILLCVITKVMGIFWVDNYKMATQKRTDGHSFDLFWGGGLFVAVFSFWNIHSNVPCFQHSESIPQKHT